MNKNVRILTKCIMSFINVNIYVKLFSPLEVRVDLFIQQLNKLTPSICIYDSNS